MKYPTARRFTHFGLAVLAVVLLFSAGCAKIQEAVRSAVPQAGAEKKAAAYYCPMHPTYTSDRPGNCPICNMALVPLEAHDDHSEHEMKPTDEQTTCLRHECPMIKAGEDCPMLLVTESGETPECPVCQKRIAESEMTPVSSANPEGYAVIALTPAKQKLIGVRTEAVTTRPLRTSIRTSGLMLASGQMDLFVYESDLPKISNESTIKATLPALGRELTGQVTRIPLSLDRTLSQATAGPSAIVSASSSQVSLRARLEDPDRVLRRGMTADVEIWTDLGTMLAVPETAVFFTGKQSIVFVEKSSGVYEPRTVELGNRADGHYAVKSGLSEGEKVVTSGNFLIDSESRLQSAFAGVTSGRESTSHAHGS